jgi:hypothetical protein
MNCRFSVLKSSLLRLEIESDTEIIYLQRKYMSRPRTTKEQKKLKAQKKREETESTEEFFSMLVTNAEDEKRKRALRSKVRNRYRRKLKGF